MNELKVHTREVTWLLFVIFYYTNYYFFLFWAYFKLRLTLKHYLEVDMIIQLRIKRDSFLAKISFVFFITSTIALNMKPYMCGGKKSCREAMLICYSAKWNYKLWTRDLYQGIHTGMVVFARSTHSVNFNSFYFLLCFIWLNNKYESFFLKANFSALIANREVSISI